MAAVASSTRDSHRLDDQDDLVGALDPSLPPVDGVRAGQDVDAPREPRLDEVHGRSCRPLPGSGRSRRARRRRSWSCCFAPLGLKSRPPMLTPTATSRGGENGQARVADRLHRQRHRRGAGGAGAAERVLRRRSAGEGDNHRRARRRRLHARDAARLHELGPADLRHELRLGRLPDERIPRGRPPRTAARGDRNGHPSAGHARHRRERHAARLPLPSTRSRCSANPTRRRRCASRSTARCAWRN